MSGKKKDKEISSESEQGILNDPNNPWVLTKKYHQVTEDGNIAKNAILIEEPDRYTNLFSNYPNSILSILLNIAIEADNDRASYLAQKALKN
ncbi:hypothetical protein RhiirB3_446557 [Rhizophagus irregularis]|nr:hypothetical protein RhiirB3_446557 [Rhizophagus irregularis]